MKPRKFVFKLWKSSEKEKEKEFLKKSERELSSEFYVAQDPKDKGRKLLTIAYKLRLL